MQIWLFIFGLAIGSFLNVIAVRYNPEKFILNKKSLGGRSACPGCGNKLNWFELVPLLSFLFLLGRCRNCKQKISLEYPVVELISGLIFVFVPLYLFNLTAFKLLNLSPISHWSLVISFLLVFETLLLVSAIDIRIKIIPDEANIFLIILGVVIAVFASQEFGPVSGSFLGPYGALFGLRDILWLNRVIALLFGVVFYGLLILITKGRGMGMGDLKLTAALGVVFGWPDIVIITGLSFIIGSLFSLPGLLSKKKGLKSFLPFGPFIAMASLVVFFWGEEIMRFYFNLFRG